MSERVTITETTDGDRTEARVVHCVFGLDARVVIQGRRVTHWQVLHGPVDREHDVYDEELDTVKQARRVFRKELAAAVKNAKDW